MELLPLLKELLGYISPKYVPVAVAVAAFWMVMYLSLGIPSLRRRVAALEADRLSATAFERTMLEHGRRQDKLADGIESVLKVVGGAGAAIVWKLAYTGAAAIAPSAELQAREWQRSGSGDQG